MKEHDVRMKEILDAAEELFSEKGYDETSVQAIIDEVGIAKGTFYHYFKSKSMLLDAILDRLLDEMRMVLDAVLANTEMDAIQKMTALTTQFMQLGQGRERLMEYIHEERNARIHLKVEKIVLPMITPYMEKIIEEGNQQGIFNVKYPRETGIALLGVSAVVFERRHSVKMDNDHDRKLIEAVFDIDERILGARPGILREYYLNILQKRR